MFLNFELSEAAQNTILYFFEFDWNYIVIFTMDLHRELLDSFIGLLKDYTKEVSCIKAYIIIIIYQLHVMM